MEATEIVDVLGGETLSDVESPKQETPEERRIKELEHQLALAQGTKDVKPKFVPSEESKKSILIHFVEDGFTASGVNWKRGQEVVFNPGTKPYEQTKDRNGVSWLAMDDKAQMRRFGKVFFRRGEWPGLGYDAIKPDDFEALNVIGTKQAMSPLDAAQLRRAAEMERNRRRMAPLMPS
jgi:hypothetical protein